MIFKARSGYFVDLRGDLVDIFKSKGRGMTTFPRSAISEVSIKSSAYDLPFLERTVVIRLENRKKYSIKRLPKKSAQELYQLLTA